MGNWGDFTPISGDTTLLATDRGPPCITKTILLVNNTILFSKYHHPECWHLKSLVGTGDPTQNPAKYKVIHPSILEGRSNDAKRALELLKSPSSHSQKVLGGSSQFVSG